MTPRPRSPDAPAVRPRPVIVVHARTPSTAEFRLATLHKLVDKVQLGDGAILGPDGRRIVAFNGYTLSEAVCDRARAWRRSGYDIVGSEQTARMWLGGLEPQPFLPGDLVLSPHLFGPERCRGVVGVVTKTVVPGQSFVQWLALDGRVDPIEVPNVHLVHLNQAEAR